MSSIEKLAALLPLVCAWAEEQEREILAQGVRLTEIEMDDARHIGIVSPERVRLLQIENVPMPSDPVLRMAATEAGLISLGTGAMSLRYGIYVRSDNWRDRALIAHELTHTAQYERLGGFEPFLKQYLTECLTVGYFLAPLEIEARTVADRIPQ